MLKKEKNEFSQFFNIWYCMFPQFPVVMHFEIIFGTMWYDRT